MIDILLNYISHIEPLTDEESKAIRDITVMKTYPKGTTLLKEGEISKECYFILSGLIREFHIREGEEITTNFYNEEQWVLSATSFISGTPANHYFTTLEETTVVVGGEEKENQLYESFPRFAEISKTIMEKGFAEQQNRLSLFLTSSPEQRYLSLMESHAHLLQRVPQYQLASYIGVKPESLSRIRKRLATQ
jgi:CRP-like cAMP-binding protein